MFCNRVLCRPLLWAGAAFLISALIGSFWVSFLLGGLLLCLGILARNPYAEFQTTSNRSLKSRKRFVFPFGLHFPPAALI